MYVWFNSILRLGSCTHGVGLCRICGNGRPTEQNKHKTECDNLL